MKKNNYYREAINIIFKIDHSVAHEMIIEIAKSKPSIVVKTFMALYKKERYVPMPLPHENDWISEVIPFLKSGQKIKAIKKCRELTGLSLKAAKQAVENLKY